MQLIQKKRFSHNRFQSRMAAQRPCRQRESKLHKKVVSPGYHMFSTKFPFLSK